SMSHVSGNGPPNCVFSVTFWIALTPRPDGIARCTACSESVAQPATWLTAFTAELALRLSGPVITSSSRESTTPGGGLAWLIGIAKLCTDELMLTIGLVL